MLFQKNDNDNKIEKYNNHAKDDKDTRDDKDVKTVDDNINKN